MFAAMTASAATLTPLAGTYRVVESSDAPVTLKRSMHADEAFVPTKQMTKASSLKAAHEADTWEALGEATFTEAIVLPVYGVDKAVFKVAAEKSTTTEGLYRLLEPYKQLAAKYPSAFSYDAAKAEPMYLQVVDGNKFYVESFNTGMTDLQDNADVLIESNTESIIKANGLNICLQALPEAFGAYAEGNFTYKTPTFNLSGQTFYSLLVPIAGLNYPGNQNGKFQVMLPGATTPKDYSIAIDYANCADGNKFSFKFSLGADVETYKLFISAGEYDASTANFGVVAANGQAFPATSTNINFDAAGKADGVYTVFAVTVDANGQLQEGTRGLVYVVNDDAANWVDMEKKALYTDDIVSSIYKNHEAPEYEVAVQKHAGTEGYYRLVNPYAAPYAFAAKNEHAGQHNHYIYINASNPDRVYLEESPIGFEYSDGAMVVTSLAYDELQGGKTPDQVTASYWGSMKDGVISFPAKALIARELDYNDAGWYYANVNNKFKVNLSEALAAESIAVDENVEAPAEYFNLQGQRVANPTAGQILIKRQGSKVEKIIAK